MAINSKNIITGVLPLVHLKHFVFCNNLISLPYFDMTGILARDKQAESMLLSEAIKLGHHLKVDFIELRHASSLSLLSKVNQKDLAITYQFSADDDLMVYEIEGQKSRMILKLPASSEILMKSFNSKFRNKIKRPIRSGLKFKIGGIELLEDFYAVFTINMRDLGSPVHSKNFIKNVLIEFSNKTKIGIVYMDRRPIACILVIGFKTMLANPWASSLREYANFRANTLQYWNMLEFACNNGFNSFDFGRSSPGEGTYKFKESWGAVPIPLHWYYASMNGNAIDGAVSTKSKFDNAINIWKKMPVAFTKTIGPFIRKNISL